MILVGVSAKSDSLQFTDTMRHTKVTLGLLAAAASLVAAADASDVTQLKTDTFDEFVKSNDIVLAEFFAPWWYVDGA